MAVRVSPAASDTLTDDSSSAGSLSRDRGRPGVARDSSSDDDRLADWRTDSSGLTDGLADSGGLTDRLTDRLADRPAVSSRGGRSRLDGRRNGSSNNDRLSDRLSDRLTDNDRRAERLTDRLADSSRGGRSRPGVRKNGSSNDNRLADRLADRLTDSLPDSSSGRNSGSGQRVRRIGTARCENGGNGGGKGQVLLSESQLAILLRQHATFAALKKENESMRLQVQVSFSPDFINTLNPTSPPWSRTSSDFK